jgi:hypothetical protein
VIIVEPWKYNINFIVHEIGVCGILINNMHDGEGREIKKMCWSRDVGGAVGGNHWLDILNICKGAG